YPDAVTLATYRQAGDGPVRDSLGAVVMPARRAVTVAAGEWDGGEAGRAQATLLGSLQDLNLYSGRDDDDNLGFSTRYTGIHRYGAPLDQGGIGRLVVEPEHEHRSRNYASFRQLIETRTFRDAWNLDARAGERDFDANRVRVSLEPYTGWTVGAGAGRAVGRVRDTPGDPVSDTAAVAITRVTSTRGEVFGRAAVGVTRAEASAEWKQARDPLRRDNDRERVAL